MVYSHQFHKTLAFNKFAKYSWIRMELLEVVHDVFEVQTSVDKLAARMMRRAHRLMNCTRAAVFLLDEAGNIEPQANAVEFSKVFHSVSPGRTGKSVSCHQDQVLDKIAGSTDVGGGGANAEELRRFAEQVAVSGQALNVRRRAGCQVSSGGSDGASSEPSEDPGASPPINIPADESCVVAAAAAAADMKKNVSVASSVGDMLFLAGETSVGRSARAPNLVPNGSNQSSIESVSITTPLPASVWGLMAMPIRNARVECPRKGVAVICNKNAEECFDEQDERWFEVRSKARVCARIIVLLKKFVGRDERKAKLCVMRAYGVVLFLCFFLLLASSSSSSSSPGLGLNNATMYLQVSRAVARQTVAFEALAYHATSSPREVERFLSMELPSIEEWNLNAVDFDDFSLDADQMVLAAVAMCQDLGLLRRFLIQP
ncbi:unnamed protein product, partial [Notodromas monacha]